MKLNKGILKVIKPKTHPQRFAMEHFISNPDSCLILDGVAGTGKTYIAVYLALNEVLEKSTPQQKIIIIRSAVPTRDIGFLPGNLEEKIAVYELPYVSIVNSVLQNCEYDTLKANDRLDFACTSFIRGLNLEDCIVVVDEAQNMTMHELDSLFTRAGQGCRFIFCGDRNQSDIKNTGFEEFKSIVLGMRDIIITEFGISDIVRSDLVKEYIIQKEEHYAKSKQTRCIDRQDTRVSRY